MPDLQTIVADIHRELSPRFGEGRLPDYIPQLARVSPDRFGLAVVTVDGAVHMAGDADTAFSIQSISKVFTLARVMQDSGEEAVVSGVGVDATGDVFNSITAVEKYKGHEMNPLVNPGAIATTSQIQGTTPDEIWSRIIGTYNDFAGRSLEVNQEVYKSESETNQRNRAIGMLMSAYGLIKKDPMMATDLYTRQCSVNVTAKDVASLLAALASHRKRRERERARTPAEPQAPKGLDMQVGTPSPLPALPGGTVPSTS